MKASPSPHSDLARFRYLLLGAAIMTYLLIVMGGIVRVTGSGLGCPDWPTCFGAWIPPMRADAIIEYLHRLIGALTSPLIVASAVIGIWRFRGIAWIRRPLTWAGILLAIQGLLGGLVVMLETPPELVAVHFALALLILGLILVAAVGAFMRHQGSPPPDRLSFGAVFAKRALEALAAVFLVLVSGALMVGNRSGFACTGFPLCNGTLIPGSLPEWIHSLHRLAVVLGSVIILRLLLDAWRTQGQQSAILVAATLTSVFFFAQGLVGILMVTRGFSVYLRALHVATASAVWAAVVTLVGLIAFAGSSQEAENGSAQAASAAQRRRDLLKLTKPIIVLLLLVTAYSGMVFGAGGWPDPGLVFWTMVGGALAAGGSGALNMVIDRQIDQRMQRTANRPIAAGRLTSAEGLAFGLALCSASFFIMAGFVNLLAALLTLVGILYYVLLYSLYLKQANDRNIIIGGGAGAIPPLVGWAATANSLNVPALFLFLIIFLWTPPHFWALAIIRVKDYTRAGIPMLPVVRGKRVTQLQILIYTMQLVAVTLLLPALNMAGIVFLVAAMMLGGGLIYAAWRLWTQGSNRSAYFLYRYSSMYLGLLFVALIVDTVV